MLSEEEKKAIEYYSNKEVSFSVDFDTEKLLKALGITEEDSFENHQIRFKTLLNLITKLQKENEDIKSRKEHQEKRFRKYKENIEKQHEEIYENLVSEKEKYVYLYQKALNNTIKADRENIQLKKQIDLMAEVIFKKFKAPLIIEYGIENKEQFIKIFEQKAKEKGK